MTKYLVAGFLIFSLIASAQHAKSIDPSSRQFVLFDAVFTYTKVDADNSSPSKSHYYIKGNLLNPDRPADWTSPVDFRNGTVHIRLEVLEKPSGDAATTWSLCYIPNKGQGNGYGCTNTGVYTKKGVYEKDVSMTAFWENDGIVWSQGIKQMDLVIKDDSGGQGHAHHRKDHEKFFPAKVRVSMIQVAAGETYDPSWLGKDMRTNDEREVAAQVEKLRQVMIKPNRPVLESLAAEALSYGHSSGLVENKKQFVDALVLGKSDFTSITFPDEVITVAGDNAVVRHHMLADTFSNKIPGKLDIMVMSVWKKVDSEWKVLARQGVKVTPPTGGR